MATTLLLDRATWDLCLDTAGDIAVAAEPYSQAQDIASECRTFEAECYYDTARGVPYLAQVLGQTQPIQILKGHLVRAAERVPGIAEPAAFLTSAGHREVTGQVQFKSA